MSLKTIFNYTSQLSSSLNAGLPINRVLDVVSRTAPTRALRAASRRIKQSIASGSTLTQAVEKHRRLFPDFFINVIEVGERTGKLEEVTKSLAAYYESRYESSRAVKKELYPILFYFAILMLLLVTIDWITGGPEAVYAYTDVLAWASIGAMVLFGAYYFSVGFRNAVADLLFYFPLVNRPLRKLYLSRFAEGMRLAWEAGLDVNSAIKLSADSSGNPAFRKQVRRACRHLEEGTSLSEALDRTGVFSFAAIQMFAVGEETGKLHETMAHVSKHSREEALTAIHLAMIMGVRLFYTLGVLYIAFRIVSFWTAFYSGMGL